MKQEVASFLNYVAASPTVFQATQQACDMLEAAGFTRLSEQAAEHRPRRALLRDA